MMKIMGRVVLFLVIVLVVQQLFIAFTPNLIFAIAQARKPKGLNEVIHAGKTDASLRKVVLPNPDFIYSACFYDVAQNDLLITGELADTSQYCSLAFYDNTVQPYYVRNNLQGFKNKFTIRLSSVARAPRTLKAKSRKGAILMRMLAQGSTQVATARRLQQTFKVQVIPQND